MKHLKTILSKNIKGKKVLSLFIITNLVYLIMIFITIPKVMKYSNGNKILDMLPFGYSYAYVMQLFNELGIEGRNVYLNYQIPVDMIYPLLFGISYSLILAYFLQKINKLKTPYLILCLFPLIAASFDYFENLGIVLIILKFPNITKTTVILNSIFTIIKSTATSIYFISLILVLIIFALKKVNKN